MVIIFDGNKRKEEILNSLKPRIEKIRRKGINPKLSIVNVGKNPASLSYIKMKIQALKKLNLEYELYDFEKIEEKDLIELIKELNEKDTNGILIQMPLPSYLNAKKILNEIEPIKDVDCLTEENLGKLMYNDETIAPCTPKGIIDILESEKIELEGKEVVIVNNSILIGKPLSIMLTNRFATVTLCHVKTKDLKAHTSKADILITATGVPKLIKKEHIKKGVVLIDAGFTKINEKPVGDVDFEEVKDLCSLITPTPGGVGPMTVAMLVKNLITCTELQLGLNE
ncbi:MAG: bifunctional 5,10-methylenetetrahydrofolate dehydrogenase/5,10-methenyltetrahydrofolate cyclohydrolase [Thermoproteota archaeon]|jgi:methylenetetrahydrofolate dehydrogenase (NADP+)/methenyltetrahydrofolate cyclohydrolase|nr:bifunctional 5,10-methylenetetrahydrofolate dehydrogenase/5,10-methenyltetrahydrofolate cyclohydrolase [Thermoproteota archaeon]